MKRETIIYSIAYSLACDNHTKFRSGRKLNDGTYELRYKKTDDTDWIAKHGTNKTDIANCSFDDLPKDWKEVYIEPAKFIIEMVFDDVLEYSLPSLYETERMCAEIHYNWQKRNDWVFDIQYGDPTLALPYWELPESEKMKIKDDLDAAIDKVKDYLWGKVEIRQD